MAWISGYAGFKRPSEHQRFFNGDVLLRKVNSLVLHGVVTEEKGKAPVPGALVKAFARSAGGKELPLTHSYSGGDGHYLMPLNRNLIPAGAVAIIVRAVVNNPSLDDGD